MLNRLYRCIKHAWLGCNTPSYYLIGGQKVRHMLTNYTIGLMSDYPNDRYLVVDCDYCGGYKYIINEKGQAIKRVK